MAPELQLRIWGYAFSGDPDEPSAHVAERQPYQVERVRWDRDERWLSGCLIVQYGERERPARPWAALPWLTEHCLRGHMTWPGL